MVDIWTGLVAFMRSLFNCSTIDGLIDCNNQWKTANQMIKQSNWLLDLLPLHQISPGYPLVSGLCRKKAFAVEFFFIIINCHFSSHGFTLNEISLVAVIILRHSLSNLASAMKRISSEFPVWLRESCFTTARRSSLYGLNKKPNSLVCSLHTAGYKVRHDFS